MLIENMYFRSCLYAAAQQLFSLMRNINLMISAACEICLLCFFFFKKTGDVTLNLKKTKKINKNSAVFVAKTGLMWYNNMN